MEPTLRIMEAGGAPKWTLATGGLMSCRWIIVEFKYLHTIYLLTNIFIYSDMPYKVYLVLLRLLVK